MRRPVNWALNTAHELHVWTFGDHLASDPTKSYLNHFEDALPGTVSSRASEQLTLRSLHTGGDRDV